MTDRLFLSPPHIDGRERALVEAVFDSNYVAPIGPMLDAFERAFCDYVGLAHAVAVSSGTAALHLLLRTLGLGPGDAVILPTLTFMGGVAPIVYQGATPLFVDIDPVSWCIDPALLDDAFATARQRGLRVRAVVPADIYGQCCDIDAIRAIATREGVPVVLDSAEAVGALRHGRHAGHGALAAAYSFNGNKIMTSSGGGMIASDDKALVERCRYLSTAARQPAAHYQHTEVGYNYRLSNVCAGIGLGQLERIEHKVAARRAIFAGYQAALGDLPGVGFPAEAPGNRHTRWLSCILFDPAQTGVTPEAVRLALETHNIESRPIWKPMHLQPVFADAPMIGGTVAQHLFDTGLCLPSGTAMTPADIERVSAIIRATIGQA